MILAMAEQAFTAFYLDDEPDSRAALEWFDNESGDPLTFQWWIRYGFTGEIGTMLIRFARDRVQETTPLWLTV
jgi:hypothetical protein